jgi:small subunit ribosomal protein S3
MNAGAKGAKIAIGGRLNGAEIARTEHLSSGKIPLHTLRADIDFARSTAYTTYGTVGIKVWIYRGDVFEQKQVSAKA